MQTFKQMIGQKGEDLACEYLKNKGFTILDRNYWRKWGEIDIVASLRHGGVNIIHFIEVKTVTRLPANWEGGTGDDYEPEDNIHPWKLKRLHRAIQTYLLEKYSDDDPDWVLDAVSVYLDGGGKLIKIEVLEDI